MSLSNQKEVKSLITIIRCVSLYSLSSTPRLFCADLKINEVLAQSASSVL